MQPSPPEALVQAYLIHIADRSNANFRKILDIKGIRSRQEQNHLVELFQIHKASDRHAPNLTSNNPILSILQTSSAGSSSATSSTSQGGLSLSTAAAASIGASNLPTRFDPSTLGSAIISAAKDGVDRFGTPLGDARGNSISSASAAASGPPSSSSTPAPAGQAQGSADGGGSSGPLNDNLKNIGKFFRRDLGGFGGRFGRGGDE